MSEEKNKKSGRKKKEWKKIEEERCRIENGMKVGAATTCLESQKY